MLPDDFMRTQRRAYAEMEAWVESRTRYELTPEAFIGVPCGTDPESDETTLRRFRTTTPTLHRPRSIASCPPTTCRLDIPSRRRKIRPVANLQPRPVLTLEVSGTPEQSSSTPLSSKE